MVSIHPIQAVKTAGANVKAKVDNMSTKQKVAAVATVAVAATALTAAYMSGKKSFAEMEAQGDFFVNGKGEELANNAFNKIKIGFMNFFDEAVFRASNLRDTIVNKFQSNKGIEELEEEFSEGAEGALDALAGKGELPPTAVGPVEAAAEALSEVGDKA